MKDVATELYKAIILVNASKEKLVDNEGGESKPLELEFSGDARLLLSALADTFFQSETHFASNLLHHALIEALKILPDILPADEFESLEQRIIENLGLESYLSLRPVFGYEQGLGIPNFAEVSLKNNTIFGRWDNSGAYINIIDPSTNIKLYSYSKVSKPTISIDGTTLQWSDMNVKPIFLSIISSKNIVHDIEKFDILKIGENSYFHREDEYADEFTFKPYSNCNHEILKDSRFTSLFNVRVLENENILIEPNSNLYRSALQSNEGSWYAEGIMIVGYSSNEVIINPSE